MTVELKELDPIERKGETLHIVQGRATLGDGTRVVMEIGNDLDEVREKARIRAEHSERQLGAVEVHDEEALEHLRQMDIRILKSPSGGLVEATAETVDALLAAGYEEVDPASTTTEPVEVGPKGKVRTRRVSKPADEM